MKIKIVAVGRVKEKYYAEAVSEYLKRISRFAKTEVTEIPEMPGDRELEKEAKAVLAKLGGLVVALDRCGERLTSEELAKKLDAMSLRSSEITFVIGGSEGLHGSVKERADFVFSLGGITLPHSLARVVLAEQIYRALTISKGGKYHK